MTSADRAVQRVTDLITLATDSGAAIEEARTAAFAACKLIKSCALKIVSPMVHSSASSSSSSSSNQSHAHPGNAYSYSRPNQQHYSNGYGNTSQQHCGARDDDKQSAKPRTINVRYASCCRVCGASIKVGTQAVWTRGSGVVHLHCQGAA